MIPINPQRFSAIQLEAMLLLARGELQLTNQGQYALVENGEVNEDLTVRKPVLRALAEKGLIEFKDIRGRLIYRITSDGEKAVLPDSPFRRPAQPPGRTPKERPVLAAKPPSGRKGFVVYFLRHPLADGRAFVTVKDACSFARRIQAGYVQKGKPAPDLIVEHRRYGVLTQKLLVRLLNGETSDQDVIERWESVCPAYSNTKTYERYEPVGD